MRTPAMNVDVSALYRRHLSTGRARLAELTGGHVETHSDGAYVYASETEFLDCGGYGVFILGHRHPRVTDAAVSQIHRNPMATRLLLEPAAALAAESLVRVAPAGLDRVHFVNSGAEAVEAAIKFARASGKTTLIAAHNGYHGKTMGALSLTGRAAYQDPFLPLLPEVCHVPYGDAEAMENALAGNPGRACVILEPVQGEAGVILPPPGYVREVAALCRRHGALLVLDEVQTGLGRLGAWWGASRENVVPDVLLVGKNLSGGVIPVAAVLATEDVYAPFNLDPLLHTSTFAASPVAMAAATATIKTLEDENLIARAGKLGERIISGLRAVLGEHCPEIQAEVRGSGLLVGVEFPSPHIAGDFVLELMANQVLVNHSLNAPEVLRLTPPAILADRDLDRLFDAFAAAAGCVAARHTRRRSGGRNGQPAEMGIA